MHPVIMVLDTETTGPTPDDKIIEIAWIEVDDNLSVVREVQSLIDPQRSISFSAQGIHGITPEQVGDGVPTIEEFFAVTLPERGIVLPDEVEIVAHNARSYRRYIEPLPFPKISGFTCTLRLARRYLPNAEDHKLTTLACQYGLHKGQAHRALDDARTCLDLLKFIVDLSEKPLRDLIAEARLPQWVPICPFKKFKGQPMQEVDKGYAIWALGNMKDLDVDMEYSLTLIAKGKPLPV